MRLAQIFTIVFCLLAAASVYAAAPSAPSIPSKPTAPDPNILRDKLYAQRAQAWQLFYAGKFEAAATLTQPLLKCDRQNVQLEAAHILARCYWAVGTNAARSQADKIWKDMEKASQTGPNAARAGIAAALALEAEKKVPQAITRLEDIVHRNDTHTCTAEAALDLARLYVQGKRFDDAQKMLAFVPAFLAGQTHLEMSAAEAAPFLGAAKSAQAQLKYQATAGLAEFEQAEKLRAAGKFNEAATVYQKIIKAYPQSDFTPRSQLNLGYCMIGLKQPGQAVKWWKDFAGTQPAGPWRGQAYLGIIDLAMQPPLALDEAQKYADLALFGLPIALTNAKAGESWKPAAFDIGLRAGILRLAQGKPGAAEALAQAAKAATLAQAKDGSLGILVALAQSGKPIIPEDARTTPDGKADAISTDATLLTLGMLENICGHSGQANSTLDQVIRNDSHKATMAQQAFADFGKAMVMERIGKLIEATDLLQKSMKAFPAGSWHDETLYQLASFAAQAAPSAAKSSTAIVSEAIGYWQTLLQKYPQSPRCEQALYNLGLLLCAQAEHADAAISDQLYIEAAKNFRQLCQTYPTSPWAGDACLRQIDIALEGLFDGKMAMAAAGRGVLWAKQAQADGFTQGCIADAVKKLPPWAAIPTYPDAANSKRMGYECYLRAALAAYLTGDYEQASKYVDAAGPSKPADGFSTGTDLAKIGLYYLQQTIKSGKPVTEARAMAEAKTPAQKLAIQLGDLYIAAIRPDKTEGVYLRILHHEPRLGNITPGLEAYATLQIAVSLDRQIDRRPKALEYLKKFEGPTYEGTYWGGLGLFRLALFTYNQTQDPKKSAPIYAAMISHYPDHEMMELARLYYCLDLVQIKEPRAEQACRDFLARYPKSEYTSLVNGKLQNEVLKDKKPKN